VLDATLHCHGDLGAAGKHEPVLLVHGTAVDRTEFEWNWMPALTHDGIPWCAVDLIDNAMVDIQASAERVVHAIRAMHDASGRRIDIVGHSQGGMIPRWALRFWPDTRSMVDDLVGIAASNHGTIVADAVCQLSCGAAESQQRSGSAFLRALNEGAETWAGISYTSIYTWTDEIVVPNVDASGSTSLHTGRGEITNVAVQDVCPVHVADHLTLGTSDPVAYALARDALDHRGPANPRRVDGSVCLRVVMPHTDLAASGAGLFAGGALIAQSLAAAPPVSAEPPLRCYVTRSCRG
jgi:triacylglycerol esterase/lipase EstA (alpha/beta hydrolase family)